jgi:hypothetical protein
MRKYVSVDLPENMPDSLYARLSERYLKKQAHDIWGLQDGIPIRKANEPSISILQQPAPDHGGDAFTHDLEVVVCMNPADLIGMEASFTDTSHTMHVGRVESFGSKTATLSFDDGVRCEVDFEHLKIAQLGDTYKQLLEKYKDLPRDELWEQKMRNDRRLDHPNPRVRELVRQQYNDERLKKHLMDRAQQQIEQRHQPKPSGPPPVVAPEPDPSDKTPGPTAPPVVPSGSQPIIQGRRSGRCARHNYPNCKHCSFRMVYAQAMPTQPPQELPEPPPGAPTMPEQPAAPTPQKPGQQHTQDTNANWAKLKPLLANPQGASIWLQPGKLGATIRPKSGGYQVTLMELRSVPMGKAQFMAGADLLQMLESNPDWKPATGATAARMATLTEMFDEFED